MAETDMRTELNGIHLLIGQLSGRQQASVDQVGELRAELAAQFTRFEDLMRQGFLDSREAIDHHADDDRVQFEAIMRRAAAEDGARAEALAAKLRRTAALKRWSIIVGIVSTIVATLIGLAQFVAPLARGAQP